MGQNMGQHMPQNLAHNMNPNQNLLHNQNQAQPPKIEAQMNNSFHGEQSMQPARPGSNMSVMSAYNQPPPRPASQMNYMDPYASMRSHTPAMPQMPNYHNQQQAVPGGNPQMEYFQQMQMMMYQQQMVQYNLQLEAYKKNKKTKNRSKNKSKITTSQLKPSRSILYDNARSQNTTKGESSSFMSEKSAHNISRIPDFESPMRTPRSDKNKNSTPKNSNRVDTSNSLNSYSKKPAVPIKRPDRRKTPPRFYLPTCCAKFGSGGVLVKHNFGRQSSATKSHNSRVQIAIPSIKKNLLPFSELIEKFPGPLKPNVSHKQDIVKFCEWRAKVAGEDLAIRDRKSKCLLWKLLALMVRQNGNLVGTDVAELLMEDFDVNREHGEFLENKSDSLDESEYAITNDPTKIESSVGKNIEKCVEEYRNYLMYGRKDEALDCAVKNKLWGHALFLSSRMSEEEHTRVSTNLEFQHSLKHQRFLFYIYLHSCAVIHGFEIVVCNCYAKYFFDVWCDFVQMSEYGGQEHYS